MNDVNTERETLEACVANLQALEPVKEIQLKERNGLPPGIDAKLVVRTDAGKMVYLVEVKRSLSFPGLEHLILQLQRYAQGTKERPLVFSNYVSPGFAERLIRAGLNFTDAAGNVYINWPHKLHIQIQGARPKQLAEAKSERLSQPSGLRILYVLLTQSPEAWGSYRDVARAAGVALGSIAVVMRELKAKGHLVQTGRHEWRLIQKRKLLDLWVTGYAARLRPSLIIGRYQPPEKDLGETVRRLQAKLGAAKTAWALTGGFAADILTRHFRGDQLSLFVQPWSSDLVKRFKWLPSEHGSVTVLRKFSPLVSFDLESPNRHPVAHPLLVYAELIFQGRERELETASILYNRYLSSLIQENGT